MDDCEYDVGQVSSVDWNTQWRTAIIEGTLELGSDVSGSIPVPHDIIGALPLAACRLGGALAQLPNTLHYH